MEISKNLARGAIAATLLLASLGNATDASLPFSEARWAGDMLFISGQVGESRGTGMLVAGGIRPEAPQALANVDAILLANQLHMTDVVKCTVFLVDMADLPAFNDEYRRYFPEPRPTRSLVVVHDLSLGARVEIECMAYRHAQARSPSRARGT